MTPAASKRMKAAPMPAPKPVADLMRRFDAATANPDWLQSIELTAVAFLDADPEREGAGYMRLALQDAKLARLCIEDNDAEGAAAAAMGALGALWQAELIEARARWFEPTIAPDIAASKKSSRAHAAAASTPRKLWPHDVEKIKIDYARRVREGERYGALQDLADAWGVNRKTISRHVKPKANGT